MAARRARAPPATAAAGSPREPSAARRRPLCLPRSLVGIQAQAQQAMLQLFVGGEGRHRAAVYDATVVHHAHRVADLLCDAEILLDAQYRSPSPLHLLEAIDQRTDDGGCETLGRLVDEQQAARLDQRARK